MKKCGIKKYRKGFGVLEVLVSSVIIITILTALVFIGRAALANSVYTQQRAQAIYLAQEGIELVRQMRDTNWIDGDNTTEWNTFEWDSTTGNYKTTVPSGDQFSILFQNNRWGLLDFSSVGESEKVEVDGTEFERIVKVSDTGGLIPNDPSNSTTDVHPNDAGVGGLKNALKVEVVITWKGIGGVDKTISVSEVLTNWRPNY